MPVAQELFRPLNKFQFDVGNRCSKEFSTGERGCKQSRKGSRHQADRLMYSHKFFEGFSVKFAQRIYMFITFRLGIIFDTLKHLIIDKIPT